MKKMIPIVILLFALLVCPVMAEGTTQDIYNDVMDKGWISRGEFNPDAVLTRAQAITTIMRMAVLLPDTAGYLSDFADTIDHPDRDFIQKARSYGVVTGGDANLFAPDRPVTRITLVTWMDRVFSLPDTVNFESKLVSDNVKSRDPEGYYAICKYAELQIIVPGQNGRFRPYGTMTMGEFALIIDRLSGAGIRDLRPVHYEGEPQPEVIVSPR